MRTYRTVSNSETGRKGGSLRHVLTGSTRKEG